MRLRVTPLLLAASLTACGKPPAPLPAPTPATKPAKPATVTAPAKAASTAVAAPVTALRVTALALGSTIDNHDAVIAPGTFFPNDTPTLYASVGTEGHGDKAVLTIYWRYLEGTPTLFSESSQVLSVQGPASTTFRVHNPDRWPVGKYRVQVTLDGKPAAQQDFMLTGRP